MIGAFLDMLSRWVGTDQLAMEAAEKAKALWEFEARRLLDASPKAVDMYTSSIEVDTRPFTTAGSVAHEGDNTVTLYGGPQKAMEEGVPEIDMRTYLLRSAKAKRSKTGARYLSVPIDPPDVFRTASDNGKPWIRRATEGANIVERVQEQIGEAVAKDV